MTRSRVLRLLLRCCRTTRRAAAVLVEQRVLLLLLLSLQHDVVGLRRLRRCLRSVVSRVLLPLLLRKSLRGSNREYCF